jgi:hypothetical protein
MSTPVPPAPSRFLEALRAVWWRPPAFLAGIGALLALFYLHGRTVYMTKSLRDDRNELERMASRRAVVLGSSHAYSIELKAMRLSGVNLAHDGQDLFEVAYIARTVKARAPKLDRVVIALSYFSFVFDNAAYVENGVKTRVGRRIDLYAGFGRFSLIPGDGGEYLKGMLWPLVTRDHYAAGFSALGVKEARAETPDDDADRDRAGDKDVDLPPGKRPPKTLQYYQDHAKRRCRHYDALIKGMRAGHPGIERDTYAVLRALIEELHDDSIKVVLVTPPYLDPYNQCFDQRWQRLTRENGARLAKETGATYLDYSTHPAFRDMSRFMDTDHLRKSHRAAFSKMLAGDLKARR